MSVGIQVGTTAWDKQSRSLEKSIRQASKEVYEELQEQYPELDRLSKLPKHMIPGGKGGCQPDGGIWLYQGEVILVLEAKKQGARGNAIERWFKNFFICQKSFSIHTYLTFCSGEAAEENGIFERNLSIASENFNKIVPGEACHYLSPSGFHVDFVKSIIRQVVLAYVL